MDTFVTDRSFEVFYKKYASETNLTFIDPQLEHGLLRNTDYR
jgi:hypothetical protein